MNTRAIYNKLKENNLKLTSQRKIVVVILQKNENKFISCEEIYEQISSIDNKINLSTVYRTLESFYKVGVLHKKTTDGKAFYKLMCLDHHHHHLICKICKKPIPFDYCPIDELSKIAKQYNFTIENHQIEIYGICSECAHLSLPTK